MKNVHIQNLNSFKQLKPLNVRSLFSAEVSCLKYSKIIAGGVEPENLLNKNENTKIFNCGHAGENKGQKA